MRAPTFAKGVLDAYFRIEKIVILYQMTIDE